MTFKATLMGGAAFGAALAIGMAGGAQAKTAKHHHKPSGPSRSEVELRSQVDSLQSEVKSLEGRLDAQAQAQQQAQAQIQAAQTQAQTAQNVAQAAQTQVAAQQSQIETIPAEVETASKKAAPKPGWWDNTKVGGTVFADLSYISNKNDGVKNAQTGVDYDIKRFYLTVDHKFNDMFSANLTTDFTYDSTTKATQLYIKKAFLQTKFSDALIIRAGAADMPWVPFVESLYGYRYVDKVLVDNYGYGTSADWGIHVLGSLLDKHLGYQISVVDGQGFRIPATGTANRTAVMDVEGRVSANFGHFTAGIGGYEGKLGSDVTGTFTFHNAERFDAVAAYTDSRIRIGGEYMYAHYWKDVLQSNPLKTNSSEAFGAFASFNFTPQIAVFGRYDWVKPQADTNSAFHSDFYNIGVSYKPIGPLDFALVYKHDSVADGLLNTGNGTIGTLHSSLIGNGSYDEIGVFTQMKF